VLEKQMATSINSDLIEFTFCLTTPPIHVEANCGEVSAEHSRSADRAGILKIECLPNDPVGVVCKLAPSGAECEPEIASLEWNKSNVA
jgi:hypothetical protein